jgi:hypothetical protein
MGEPKLCSVHEERHYLLDGQRWRVTAWRVIGETGHDAIAYSDGRPVPTEDLPDELLDVVNEMFEAQRSMGTTQPPTRPPAPPSADGKPTTPAGPVDATDWQPVDRGAHTQPGYLDSTVAARPESGREQTR